jgi:hypothetical protein
MLTQLATIKSRLTITTTDYDDLLTNAIKTVSARFDHECNRTFSRTVNALEEFGAHEIEIRPACYPIENVTKFEMKRNETEGWLEQTGVEFLMRNACVVSLSAALDPRPSTLCRLTYTGGYVLPGTTPGANQIALPADLEQAAVEQVAYWYRNRDKLGLVRSWPHGGTYETFAQLDLLLDVKAVLRKYERWSL